MGSVWFSLPGVTAVRCGSCDSDANNESSRGWFLADILLSQRVLFGYDRLFPGRSPLLQAVCCPSKCGKASVGQFITILMNKSLFFSPPGPLRKGRILVYYLCTIIRCRLCTDLVKIVRIGHCPILKWPAYGYLFLCKWRYLQKHSDIFCSKCFCSVSTISRISQELGGPAYFYGSRYNNSAETIGMNASQEHHYCTKSHSDEKSI